MAAAATAPVRRPISTLHQHTLLLSHFQQTATLVNLKLKHTRDLPLDRAVSREKHLHAALHLINALTSPTPTPTPTPKPFSSFLLHYPSLFHHHSPTTSRSRRLTLTPLALRLHQEHRQILRDIEPDLVDRVRKLLMLTSPRSLPIHTIDQLQFDLGLPFDYSSSLLPRYPQFFQLHRVPGDERLWLGLVGWDDRLAVSEFERENSGSSEFPVRFTRGFGMRKRWMEWLAEWQRLPYVSPYVDPSGIDPRTDVSEKRNVGVFHEILSLTIGKKTERRNVSNLRKPLGLPQKFTKVFDRHPGIFYLSEKLATQTVVLREAYGGGSRLIRKHPLMEVREKYIAVMRTGMLDGGGGSDSCESDEECERLSLQYVSPEEDSDETANGTFC